MNALLLIFIFLFICLIASGTVGFENDQIAIIAGIIVLIIGLTFSIWAGISFHQNNEIKETQLLPIENKIVDGKTIQLSYYSYYDDVTSFNITKKYGFSLDKDKYLVKREVYKHGPYIGLYWMIPDKFTIIEKEIKEVGRRCNKREE